MLRPRNIRRTAIALVVPVMTASVSFTRTLHAQTPVRVETPADSAAREARLAWFREAKYGLFIHWGLYAIPAGQWKGQTIPGIGEWIMNRAKVPVAEYSQLASRFNPVLFDAGAGYRADDQDWKSPGDVVFKLVDIVSKGGNYLLNVGPMANGEMPQAAQDILHTAGAWLKVNGEAVYGAQPTPFGDELGELSVRNKDSRGQPIFLARSDYRVTAKPGKLYFTFFGAQRNPFVLPHMQNAVTRAYRLADGAPFEVREVNGEKQMQVVGVMNTDPMATVIIVEIAGKTVRR